MGWRRQTPPPTGFLPGWSQVLGPGPGACRFWKASHAAGPDGPPGLGVSETATGLETTSPSVVFKSTQNLPESLKCVFFFFYTIK